MSLNCERQISTQVDDSHRYNRYIVQDWTIIMSERRFHDYSALTFGKPQLFDELKNKLNKTNYKEDTLFISREVVFSFCYKSLNRR